MGDERCKEKVWEGMGWFQCQRRATRDGYCFQHHPDSVGARREASRARYEAKLAHDPMAIASERIRTLEQSLAAHATITATLAGSALINLVGADRELIDAYVAARKLHGLEP